MAVTPTPAPPAPAPAIGPDPAVSVAFALGWQVAALYRRPHRYRPRQRSEPPGLPGYSDFSGSERTQLGLDQVEAGINRLWLRVGAAGLDRPDTTVLTAAFEGKSGAPDELAELRWSLLALHVELLEKLLAADFRLGKAYALGRVLADTCVWPEDDTSTPQGSFERAFGQWRLEGLRLWLADLDSTLPPHAAKAVGMSLGRWEEWARAPQLGGKPLDWAADGAQVSTALRRQGQLWRALLSGEKGGADMLHPDGYLRAARELLSGAGHLALTLVKQLWFVIVPAVALVVLAVVLLASSDRTATDLAAAAAFVAGLGITWQSVGAAGARLADHLREPLWGAALNEAIADAVTELPRPAG